jgi:hypothetical protein
MKYGPVAVGVLQYLSMIPKMNDIERAPVIDKLNWDMQGFDSTRRSTPNQVLAKELKACSSLMPHSNPDAARRFLTQGSTTVTWSGFDALFSNLEGVLGISAQTMTLHDSASKAIEFALGELLDARGAEPTLVVTSDAEHHRSAVRLKIGFSPYIDFGSTLFPSRISYGRTLPRRTLYQRC